MYVTEPSYVAGFRDTEVTVTCRALSGASHSSGSLDNAGLVSNPGGAAAVVQELYDEGETTLEDVYTAYFSYVGQLESQAPYSLELHDEVAATVDDYVHYTARLQNAYYGCVMERAARTGGLAIGTGVALAGIILIAGTVLVRRTPTPNSEASRHLQSGLAATIVLVALGSVVTVSVLWNSNPTLTLGAGGATTTVLECRAVGATPLGYDFSGTYLTTEEPYRYSDMAGFESDTSLSNVFDTIVESFVYYDGEPDAQRIDPWQSERRAMEATQAACGARRDEQLAAMNLTLWLSVTALTLLQGGLISNRLRPTGRSSSVR